MCGIAGLLDLTGTIPSGEMARLAGAMAGTLAHRGPDDQGVWVSPDGRCALAHRRLSIIDTSSAGHQPMISADDRHALSYNGELYNFEALRPGLARAGWTFRTRSDTEVLLAGLATEGTAFLTRTDAMYALAWYDVVERRLVLARDPFGEKPLCWWTDGRLFAFASEIQALALLPGFRPRIDRTRVFAYLGLQYVPAPAAIYLDVAKLPPGSGLVVGADGRQAPFRHFAFVPAAGDGERPLDALADELEDILVRTVETRLISDVPLGAFLSGGVDSSTVVAIARRRLGREVTTFSLGFAGAPSSEHLAAREIAEALGTRHHERVIDVDLLDMFDRIADLLDEPNGDTSCLPTWLLSGLTREQVTVALSGDGGDEMFGGYGRYFSALADEATMRAGREPWPGWTRGIGYYNRRIQVFGDGMLEQAAGPLPVRYRDLIGGWRADLDRSDGCYLHAIRASDVANYLPGAVLAKVDRMSMRHGLEVRAPLLGRAVAEFAAGLSEAECVAHGSGKQVLKRVASRHLPEAWMNRPKTGFGLPIADWGTDALRARARTLATGDCRLAAFLDMDRLRAYVAGDAGTYQLWALLLLEAWLARHPAEPVPEPAEDPSFPVPTAT